MKASNIILSVVFLFGMSYIGYLSIMKSNSTLAGVAVVCGVLFACSFNLLLEDAAHAAKARKRRATALKMTGYRELRQGGWMKVLK